MFHKYILDNFDILFQNENLRNKFMLFDKRTNDIDEIINQNKVEGQKKYFRNNLLIFGEKLLTKHHNRIKEKKL